MRLRSFHPATLRFTAAEENQPTSFARIRQIRSPCATQAVAQPFENRHPHINPDAAASQGLHDVSFERTAPAPDVAALLTPFRFARETPGPFLSRAAMASPSVMPHVSASLAP